MSTNPDEASQTQTSAAQEESSVSSEQNTTMSSASGTALSSGTTSESSAEESTTSQTSNTGLQETSTGDDTSSSQTEENTQESQTQSAPSCQYPQVIVPDKDTLQCPQGYTPVKVKDSSGNLKVVCVQSSAVQTTATGQKVIYSPDGTTQLVTVDKDGNITPVDPACGNGMKIYLQSTATLAPYASDFDKVNTASSAETTSTAESQQTNTSVQESQQETQTASSASTNTGGGGGETSSDQENTTSHTTNVNVEIDTSSGSEGGIIDKIKNKIDEMQEKEITIKIGDKDVKVNQLYIAGAVGVALFVIIVLALVAMANRK